MSFSVGQGVQLLGKTGTVFAVTSDAVRVIFDDDAKREKRTFRTEYVSILPSDHDPLPLSGKRKAPLVEWVDPGTGETHTCPKAYLTKLRSNIQVGKDNAKTATELLSLMGETDNETNKRHLRQAALYLKQKGIHVISYRSSKGGYFVASSDAEVKTYTDEQRKLAVSMIKEANKMDSITITNSQAAFHNLPC